MATNNLHQRSTFTKEEAVERIINFEANYKAEKITNESIRKNTNPYAFFKEEAQKNISQESP